MVTTDGICPWAWRPRSTGAITTRSGVAGGRGVRLSRSCASKDSRAGCPGSRSSASAHVPHRFPGFVPETVAAFGAHDVERLLADAGIVRHRGKIEATIANARGGRAARERGVARRAGVATRTAAGAVRRGLMGELPAKTPESTALSKELRRHGFRFVGPTTAYAAMQSLGLVNDHLACCPAGRGRCAPAALVRP